MMNVNNTNNDDNNANNTLKPYLDLIVFRYMYDRLVNNNGSFSLDPFPSFNRACDFWYNLSRYIYPVQENFTANYRNRREKHQERKRESSLGKSRMATETTVMQVQHIARAFTMIIMTVTVWKNGGDAENAVHEHDTDSGGGDDGDLHEEIWKEAEEELTELLNGELTDASVSSPRFQAGLIAIGTFVRFYWRGEDELDLSLVLGELCHEYPGSGGKRYELKEDSSDIQRILLEIKEEAEKE